MVLPAAARAGDAAEGERLARRACGYCHAIAAGPSPMAAAPPFASIARSKKFRVSGSRLVTGNRVKMPSFAFTDEQAADITAYLKSLAIRRVPR
jgi:mono/diheme cytochrome c family protein